MVLRLRHGRPVAQEASLHHRVGPDVEEGEAARDRSPAARSDCRKRLENPRRRGSTAVSTAARPCCFCKTDNWRTRSLCDERVTKGKGPQSAQRLFEGTHNQIRWMEWTTKDTRRPVRTRTLLWKKGPRTMVFAFQGWSGDRARNVHHQAERLRQLYRRRFGIETSYRQKNQAKAVTTSRDPVYRLLLEGLGYLFRQVWVRLEEELARRSRTSPNAWISALPMQRMLDWLVRELSGLHPETLELNGATT